ncbi:MAG: division/cell wall cluster transcriptional repressor MraZ [Clostridia bacterium]
MFLGKTACKLDAKGRLIVYSKFREQINEQSLIISRIHDDHLILLLESELSSEIEKIEAEDRPRKEKEDILRYLCGNSEYVNMDSQGRITIPKIFIEHAQLSNKVVQVGKENKIEIWDETRWSESQNGNVGIKI